MSRILHGANVPRTVTSAWAERPESIHDLAAAIEGLDPGARAEVARLLSGALPAAERRDRPLTATGIRSLALAGFEIGISYRGA
jgi:hypothetical protein